MNARASRWAEFPVGTRVKCADPDAFLSHIARKLRDREGVVARHQQFGGPPIVEFPAVGRRKAFVWIATDPRLVVRVDTGDTPQ